LSFWDYYKYYLSLHQNIWCRRLHFMGQIATLVVLFTILAHGGWYLLLLPLVPFVVYPFAWTGHFVFERNHPAAFTNPLWAKACDWVMFWDILRGKQTL